MLNKDEDIKEVDMNRNFRSRLDSFVNLLGRRIDRKRNRQNVGVFLHLCIFYTKLKKYALLLKVC